MLIEELSKDVKKLEVEENRVYEFINGISLIMQCSKHSNRQFSQIPDFNMILHNMPIKLNAFYSAYMSYVTKVFNSLNAEYSENYNSCFLICPGLKEQTQVKVVFQNRPPENRLLLAEIPEKQLRQDFISSARPHETDAFYNYTETMKRSFFKILSRLLRQETLWQRLIKRDQKLLYSDLLTKNPMNEACFNKINSFPLELDKLQRRLFAPGRDLSELNQIINDMIKEVYADLMSILTLRLTPFRYVNAIRCSLPPMSAWDCPIVIRLALVFRSMMFERDADETGHSLFNFVWNRDNLFELKNYPELAGLYREFKIWFSFLPMKLQRVPITRKS